MDKKKLFWPVLLALIGGALLSALLNFVWSFIFSFLAIICWVESIKDTMSYGTFKSYYKARGKMDEYQGECARLFWVMLGIGCGSFVIHSIVRIIQLLQ